MLWASSGHTLGAGFKESLLGDSETVYPAKLCARPVAEPPATQRECAAFLPPLDALIDPIAEDNSLLAMQEFIRLG